MSESGVILCEDYVIEIGERYANVYDRYMYEEFESRPPYPQYELRIYENDKFVHGEYINVQVTGNNTKIEYMILLIDKTRRAMYLITNEGIYECREYKK